MEVISRARSEVDPLHLKSWRTLRGQHVSQGNIEIQYSEVYRRPQDPSRKPSDDLEVDLRSRGGLQCFLTEPYQRLAGESDFPTPMPDGSGRTTTGTLARF
jgi:hypothetical protein